MTLNSALIFVCIRDDIPALYNNLDASLDTTAFSQYTQSQEESMYVLELLLFLLYLFFGHCKHVSFRDKLTKDEKDQPEEEADIQLKVKQYF